MSAPTAWATSGAMSLTGDRHGSPLDLPWPVADRAQTLGRRFGLDAGVLAERAAAGGLVRRGQVSCGGSARLLPAADLWVALNLARADDGALLPALFGEAIGGGDPWDAVATEVGRRPASELDEQAGLLGLGFSVVGSMTGPSAARGNGRPGAVTPSAPLVVDLSALWAGPLCTHLLQRAGARVIKVEDSNRPDGARGGPVAFFDLLNEGKDSVALDLRSLRGRGALNDLLGAADVIVTSSRARAFEQLGVVVEDVLSGASDKIWTAVTAYGWDSSRVGFGDDVAAGVGLVAWHPGDGEPRFAADAVADPLCGLEAAALTLDCLAAGGRWFVDASLAGAAARATAVPAPARAAQAHKGAWAIDGHVVPRPRCRVPSRPAPALGSATGTVLAHLAA